MDYDDDFDLSYQDDDNYVEPKKRVCNFRPSRRGLMWFLLSIAFVSSTTNNAFLPSFFLFVQHMGSCHATALWQGVGLSLQSLGQFLASLVFVKLEKTMSHSKLLLIALSLELLGNLLYAVSGSLWLLLPSRFIQGLGSSVIIITRRYLILTASDAKSMEVPHFFSMIQSLAYMTGPLIAAALSLVNVHLFGPLYFDMFTAPAYVCAFLNLLCIISILIMYRSLPEVEEHEEEEDLLETDGSAYPEEATGSMRFISVAGFASKAGLYSLIGLFVICTQTFVFFETTIPPTTQSHFGWGTPSSLNLIDNCQSKGISKETYSDGVLLNGGLFVLCGVFHAAFSFLFTRLNRVKIRRVRSVPRLYLLVSWLMMMLGCLILVSWGFHYALWRYVLGLIILISCGFSVTQKQILELYSHVMHAGKSRTQAIVWLMNAGALARIIGPIIIGLLFSLSGLDLVVTLMFDLLAVGFALLSIGWRSIVPPFVAFNQNDSSIN